jgi:mRNA-decapping enzyme 1B
VYSRVAEPFHSIFINNRLNTNSLVEPITKQIELQEQAPFLLYRNQRSAISGFWFYCKEDCVRVHALLEKLINKCNNARPAENNNPQNHPVVQQQQQQQVFAKNQNGNGGKQDVDIFSMLSKAQEDFNNSGVPERSSAPPQQIIQNFAGMQLNNPPPPQQQKIHHQPIMKQPSNAMPDITSPNVVNFFAAAQQPNGKSDGGQIQKQNKQFIANHPKVPPVQTLDEIEKQHRVSASPPQSKIGKIK